MKLSSQPGRTLFLAILFSLLLSASITWASDRKRVFVDGIFDLPHYGHQGALKNAIQAGADFFHIPTDQIDLVVGVTTVSEDEFKQYKRTPIYSIEEKERTLKGFAGVREVLRSPMVTTEKFMQDHSIDLVVAGSDYSVETAEGLSKVQKYYGAPYRLKRFSNFKRTDGISTSDLIYRVVMNTAEALEEKVKNNPHAAANELDTLNQFKALLKAYLKK